MVPIQHAGYAAFLPHLRYRVVRLMCDNAMTVAYIKNEGGTGSYTLMQLTIRLLKWCDRKVIKLFSVHLLGFHNIQADSLSRIGQTVTTNWMMAMEHLRQVFVQRGKFQVDLLQFMLVKVSLSLCRRTRTKGRSSHLPCLCPGPGWICWYAFHRSRWFLKSCARSVNLQAFRWFWSLRSRRQLPGSRNSERCLEKIRSPVHRKS